MLESPAADLVDILCQLREASRYAQNGNSETTRAHIGSAILMLQHYPAGSGPAPKPSKTADEHNRTGALPPWRACRILAHIEKNLYRPVGSCELAKVVGLSDSRFSKAFRIRFGVSVHAYVTFRRIEVSRHLMLTTEAPLSEIALSCGMSDQAHFTKVFKRMVGQPPSRWRKSQQNDRSDSKSSATGLNGGTESNALNSSERLRRLIDFE
jgi:AraC family transcriptional regulator